MIFVGFTVWAGVRPQTEMWRVLDKCHHMLNVAEYEGTLDIGERIVTDSVAACETVARAVDVRDGK